MSEQVELKVNGTSVVVPSGATVAVAIALAGAACRKSVSGELGVRYAAWESASSAALRLMEGCIAAPTRCCAGPGMEINADA